MKCLEKDRTRRYETANGLAADLKRHLNNEPVAARPPSAAYRFQKAFRRNKLVFAAGTAIAAALVLGIIGTGLGLVRAERQRREAEAARKLAEERFQSASRFVDDVFKKVAPEFSDLIGATKAQETLAQTSVSFLESLGGTNGDDEAFQAELATLYRQLAKAFGNPWAPNSFGDYSNALRFANRSLAIEQTLWKKHPDDLESVRQLALTQDAVGSISHASQRDDEALVHYRRSLELFRQLHDLAPADTNAEFWVRVANFRIAGALMIGDGAIPFTRSEQQEIGPKWMDGGRRVIFTRRTDSGYKVMAKSADEPGPEQIITEGDVEYLSSSGKYLIVYDVSPTGKERLMYGAPGAQPWRGMPFPEAFDHISRARLSPDARRLAYQSAETGKAEIYLVDFPGFTNRRIVSRGGGDTPKWNPNGTELFYLSDEPRAMLSVKLKPEGRGTEEPVKVFDLPESIPADPAWSGQYDVAADGEHFVMVQNVKGQPASLAAKPSVRVVLNWFEEFREKK